MDGSIDLSLEFIDSTYNPVFEVQSLPFIASNFDEMEYIFSPGSNVYSLVDKGLQRHRNQAIGRLLRGPDWRVLQEHARVL